MLWEYSDCLSQSGLRHLWEKQQPGKEEKVKFKPSSYTSFCNEFDKYFLQISASGADLLV